MEGETEMPFLPGDFVVGEGEAGAIRLRDVERRESGAVGAERGRVDVVMVAGDGDVAVDVGEVDDFAGGEVDVGDDAFDGVGREGGGGGVGGGGVRSGGGGGGGGGGEGSGRGAGVCVMARDFSALRVD